MAFVRVKKVTANGKAYFYAYLVESVWEKELKQARQKVLRYIGKAKNLKAISKEVIEAIFKSSNYACNNCASKEYLTIDHIIPLAKGGLNSKENLQALCLNCNQKKGVS